jgi:hypothetical protein
MQYYIDSEPEKTGFKKSKKEDDVDYDDDEDDDDDDDDDEDADYVDDFSLSYSEEEPKTPQKSTKGTKILSFEDFVAGLDED